MALRAVEEPRALALRALGMPACNMPACNMRACGHAMLVLGSARDWCVCLSMGRAGLSMVPGWTVRLRLVPVRPRPVLVRLRLVPERRRQVLWRLGGGAMRLRLVTVRLRRVTVQGRVVCVYGGIGAWR